MRRERPTAQPAGSASGELGTLVPLERLRKGERSRRAEPTPADCREGASDAPTADGIVEACSAAAEGLAAVRAKCSVDVKSTHDIVTARNTGKEMAEWIGFSATDRTLIATAISELARNQILYAGSGTITLEVVASLGRRGLVVTARDAGPGIPAIEDALEVGFSTSGGMGLGLPGARKLMDEIEINSGAGRGTQIVAKKWLR